ncbi:MAG: RNA 2',3'-cyclic phosphodiesterase [Candidatus Aramenus sp.]|nr:RNA 2',3'-cyclic phosphodiesterase [Candidatus Aramenus sp.]
MRLFIAIKIEGIPTILSLLEDLRLIGADVKLVEPENVHVTLAFLGEVEDSRVEAIRSAMDGVKFNKFNVTLRGMGAFPSLSRPRVVWVGIEKGFNQMKEIRDQLVQNLKKVGVRPENDNEFLPHVTLGRVKGPRNLPKLSEFITKNADIIVGEMEVREITLFKSTLTPRGPIYEQLHSARSSA